ncbi:Saponin hydrolase [Fusarium keratoplasticum]|uniref:Saponin hydrolase n=1 Tax=Fusarium keratoplasticum TaxID=1328300 RepID=A0ACC0QTE4_9HYPO|nr:Saponin hydrolase [Fusarium keratoplasticum]KAI8665974.1 Saponin hydrolase [Fusarium keratoplasticum]
MHFFDKATVYAILCGSVGQTAHAAAVTTPPASVPNPPSPEPITLKQLPLPPISPSDDVGACTKQINSRGTGCLANGVFETFQSGDFLPDGKHVIAMVTFTGAPAAPAAGSIYSGPQVIIVKTDGKTFPNGDPWKCITCGVPEENAVGISVKYDYPQAFKDGKRLLIGHNILDCGTNQLTSEACKPENTYIYPLRWNVAADGSGPSGDIRELRLHPDNVHLEFSSFTFASGSIGQYAYFSRLVFNPSPKTGTPLAPRYDLEKVTILHNPKGVAPITAKGKVLSLNPQAISVGEARGFNGDGTELTYVGSNIESCNNDVFAVHLQTGVVRRLTNHPEYPDPLAFSPDNKWMAVMDTRGSGRNMFIAGMRGIPPLVDIVGGILPASSRNNGLRRFFQPYLIDFYGDRGNYYGQKINGDNNGVPGSGAINDPEWNGMADPRWSPDSRQLVFWQTHTVSPSCGGANPLPCYPSKEQGGRNYRMYIATFTSRSPSPPAPVKEHSDTIPWGVPYVPGSQVTPTPGLAGGIYTLYGKASGEAKVNITWGQAPEIGTVSVVYKNYSLDGKSFLNGNESVTGSVERLTDFSFDWYSDIRQTGAVKGSKKTSPGGYHANIDVMINDLTSNGTLTTTLDGVEWRSPQSGT